MTTTEARLAAGAGAPDIKLESADGTSTGLASLWGEKPVALIFLHALDSQLATELAIQWRDGGDGIGEAGGEIAAVCDASPAGVAEFSERWHLPYVLLSDLMCHAYGAFGVSPELPGAFVIDTGGIVRYVHRNVEPLDSPSTWSLVDAISAITGKTVARPEPIVIPEEKPGEQEGAPAPGQHELDFTCAKCGGVEYEVLDVSTASGMLSRMVNFQNRRFSAVVCERCKYTELYQAESGKLRNIADLLIGS